MISTEKDRRKNMRIRHPFKLMHGLYKFPGTGNQVLHHGVIVDISAQGIKFVSDFEYPRGSLSRIEISLGSWNRFLTGFKTLRDVYQAEPFVVLGSVLRSDMIKEEPEGSYYETAVSFLSVDEGHRQAVDRFIIKWRNTIQQTKAGL